MPCGDGIAPRQRDGRHRRPGVLLPDDDGSVWSLQSDTTTVPLFRGLESTRDPRNGRNPAPWLNQVYFRSGDSFYRLSGTETATFDPVGPGAGADQHRPRARARALLRRVRLGYYGFAGATTPPAGRRTATRGPAPSSCATATGCPPRGTRRGWLQLRRRLRRGAGGVGGEGDHGARRTWTRPPSSGTTRRRGQRPACAPASRTAPTAGSPAPRNGPNPFAPDAAGTSSPPALSFLRWPRHSMDAPADLKGYLSCDGHRPLPRPLPLGGRAVPGGRGRGGGARGSSWPAPCGRRPSG